MCDAYGKCGTCSGKASVPGGGKVLNYNIRKNGFGIVYSFSELPSFAYTAGSRRIGVILSLLFLDWITIYQPF